MGLYIPCKDIILLIGGQGYRDYGAKMVGIWRYFLKTKKWEKVSKFTFDYFNVSVTMTSNQHFVIIAGGYNIDRVPNDKIFVLDIRDDNNYKLRKSGIISPLSGYQHIVRIGGGLRDEMLVIGWIRKMFKCAEFNDLSLPPTYIMQLISLWYNQEAVHFLTKSCQLRKSSHYVI